MLGRFFSNFSQDKLDYDTPQTVIRSRHDVIPALSGRSYNEGLYKVHSSSQGKRWTGIVTKVFRQYADRVECFGCDWLGRQFALDLAGSETEEIHILMFQVGIGKVYQIPSDIASFHNQVLVDMPEPTLEKTLYNAWRMAGNPAPNSSKCAGYKVPPILGGRDEVDNLVLIDMEVEWDITGQLLEVSSKIPEGSRISKMQLLE